MRASATASARTGVQGVSRKRYEIISAGVTSRDSTFEAVEALLDKRLTGFGELFRMLSYEEVGAAAMLSRAQGGRSGPVAA